MDLSRQGEIRKSQCIAQGKFLKNLKELQAASCRYFVGSLVACLNTQSVS